MVLVEDDLVVEPNPLRPEVDDVVFFFFFDFLASRHVDEEQALHSCFGTICTGLNADTAADKARNVAMLEIFILNSLKVFNVTASREGAGWNG